MKFVRFAVAKGVINHKSRSNEFGMLRDNINIYILLIIWKTTLPHRMYKFPTIKLHMY